MKKMPNEKSSLKEILNFKPTQFLSSYCWYGGRRDQLIRHKTSLSHRIMKRIRSVLPL